MPVEHGAISVRESRFVVGRLGAGMAGRALQEFSELLGGIAQVDEPADKFFVYAVRMFFLRYAEGRDGNSNVSSTSSSHLRYHHHLLHQHHHQQFPHYQHTTTLLDGGASSGRYIAMFCFEYSVQKVRQNGLLWVLWRMRCQSGCGSTLRMNTWQRIRQVTSKRSISI